MVVLEFFGSLTLVEMMLFGFIGSNMALVGTFLVQHGVKKATAKTE
jgi:hypothetical protein